jgi:hypothetical protein
MINDFFEHKNNNPTIHKNKFSLKEFLQGKKETAYKQAKLLPFKPNVLAFSVNIFTKCDL